MGRQNPLESTARQSKSLVHGMVHNPFAGPPPKNISPSAVMHSKPAPQLALFSHIAPMFDIRFGVGAEGSGSVGRLVGTGAMSSSATSSDGGAEMSSSSPGPESSVGSPGVTPVIRSSE